MNSVGLIHSVLHQIGELHLVHLVLNVSNLDAIRGGFSFEEEELKKRMIQ